jgi:3-deoxy-D-manno-octulosonic-acid transferase
MTVALFSIMFILALLYFCILVFQKQTFRVLSIIVIPIIKLYIDKRVSNGLEDETRKTERLGFSSKTKPDGTLIWIHAVSVGEVLSVIPFITRFKKIRPDINILLTTTTLTSSKIVAARCEDLVIHQFAPFDIYTWVRRFVDYWRPVAAFFVESELWPNTLHYLNESHIPVYMLNVRISKKTLKRLYIAQRVFKISSFGLFKTVYTTTEEMKRHITNLGAKNSVIAPNLKMLADLLPVDEKKSKIITAKIGKRKVWIAVSTHAAEEEIIYEVHKQLKEAYPDVLTILAVRHPSRANDVFASCSALGLSSTKYSDIIQNTKQITENIWIINQLGCLGDFFKVVDTVLVCGSLVPGIGGHNFIEPLKFACNVATGEYIDNFNDMYQEVTGFCKKLKSQKEITDFVSDSFSHYVRNTNIHRKLDFEEKWTKKT